MRTTLMLAGLAAVGCQSETELQYRSTVAVETDGVALSEDGLTSFAAMSGTTCALDVRWGCPTRDDDLPTDREQVLDHYAGVTLARSEGRLHFVDADGWDEAEDLLLPGLRTAGMSRAGLLVLTEEQGCALAVGAETVALDASFCAAERYAVDRDGALLAATADGVYRADAQRLTRLAERGDRFAADPSAARVFVATAGERRLRALDHAGQEAWSVELPHAVRELAARGDKGDAVVLAESSDGLGAILRIDGATGEVRSDSRVPSADAMLITSGNGRTLALVTDSEVHHYEVDVDGETAPVGDEVTCDDLPVPNTPGVGAD